MKKTIWPWFFLGVLFLCRFFFFPSRCSSVKQKWVAYSAISTTIDFCPIGKSNQRDIVSLLPNTLAETLDGSAERWTTTPFGLVSSSLFLFFLFQLSNSLSGPFSFSWRFFCVVFFFFFRPVPRRRCWLGVSDAQSSADRAASNTSLSLSLPLWTSFIHSFTCSFISAAQSLSDSSRCRVSVASTNGALSIPLLGFYRVFSIWLLAEYDLVLLVFFSELLRRLLVLNLWVNGGEHLEHLWNPLRWCCNAADFANNWQDARNPFLGLGWLARNSRTSSSFHWLTPCSASRKSLEYPES